MTKTVWWEVSPLAQDHLFLAKELRTRFFSKRNSYCHAFYFSDQHPALR